MPMTCVYYSARIQTIWLVESSAATFTEILSKIQPSTVILPGVPVVPGRRAILAEIKVLSKLNSVSSIKTENI